MRSAPEERASAIIDVVIELLTTGGYDAVQVREVAKRARISLNTLYKHFPTRDELIVAAIAQWTKANAYAELPTLGNDVTLYEGVMAILRAVFEPWEKYPRMLEASYRARNSPGGDRLALEGLAAAGPLMDELFRDADLEYRMDFDLVLGHVLHAVIARFADHEISVTDILPIVERTVYQLTEPPRFEPVREEATSRDTTPRACEGRLTPTEYRGYCADSCAATPPASPTAKSDTRGDHMAEATTDIATLAEQLRADFETCGDKTPLWPSLCANPVSIHHVPAGAGDGPMDGTLMPELVGWEHSAFRAAAPDWGYRDVTADVDGDTIHFHYDIGGTLNGKQYSCPTDLRLQIRDGRIIRLEGTVGESHANFVRELRATGGFEMPTELIERAMKAQAQTS